ncbi:MAG: SGNH/GDSL hydrolase family protein [Marvinbryantia sp.]|uniref:SGNH/GDSL hydrolase family protein n=2 Tax=Marvinbryantia sp. TaxID=2496532 RepID=UPI0025EBD437|nr:SGNH/GDSL hydrolase family protein [uncultured Marvinbryantia sp.]
MKHIVCFGDSNTHGYCAENNGRFDETQRWTCLLQKGLGDDYLVLEEGLSGRTTCFTDPIHEGLNGLDYIYPCLMSHEPVDLLIIMLGTNDTKERFGSSAACIALGLKRLIAKAIATTDCWRDGKPNILVVTPQNIGREYADTEVAQTMGRGCAKKSEGLAAQYEQIAKMMGCHYLDANQVVSAGPNQVDFMHLTEDGHRQLAQALLKIIPTIM